MSERSVFLSKAYWAANNSATWALCSLILTFMNGALAYGLLAYWNSASIEGNYNWDTAAIALTTLEITLILGGVFSFTVFRAHVIREAQAEAQNAVDRSVEQFVQEWMDKNAGPVIENQVAASLNQRRDLREAQTDIQAQLIDGPNELDPKEA